MNIHEFVLNMEQSLVSFEKYWIANHAKDSVNFPYELPEGDMTEQFAFFMDIERRE